MTLVEGGRVQDPCKFPSPGCGFGLPEKRNLRLVTVCEPCALGELLKEPVAEVGLELKRSTVLTTAQILSSCSSPEGLKPVDLPPRSLLLDVTE